LPDLRSDLAELGIYVQRVSEATGIPLDQVEKDFWITEALRVVSDIAADQGVDLIFKGGTSLSKGFGMISRFSEDVDLLVVFPEDLSREARHRVFRAMAKAAAEALLCEPIVDERVSETGVKRPVTLRYPSELISDAKGLRNEGLYLELGSRGGTHPSATHEFRSLIAENAASVELPDDFEEAAPISIETLDPARTLIEKLLILHDAATQEDELRKRATARHYYDIHCLLNRDNVRASVQSVGARAMADDVAHHSAMADLPATRIPDHGFPESPAFDPGSNAAARDEYEKVVVPLLLWPGTEQPTFEACCGIVSQHSPILTWN
jgi:Nucleotidyl transferase AbiEii toxin, Type IV TA system